MVSEQAFTSIRLGPLTLKNRFIKAATFEGVMPRGQVSDALIDFHTEVARGGAAMTTVAYCASPRWSRSTATQSSSTRSAPMTFAALTDSVRGGCNGVRTNRTRAWSPTRCRTERPPSHRRRA